MSDTSFAAVTFPSLKAARSARDRLAQAGFARNSIDIERHDEGFDVSITTRTENKARAVQILQGSPIANDLRRAKEDVLEAVHGNRSLALGVAALAGFALFSVMRRR